MDTSELTLDEATEIIETLLKYQEKEDLSFRLGGIIFALSLDGIINIDDFKQGMYDFMEHAQTSSNTYLDSNRN